jgi:nucleoside-diphosphate-sugar epimerase
VQNSQLLTHSHSRPKAPARVVLLGGTGFIGLHIARALEEEGVESNVLSSSELDLNAREAREMLIETLRPTDSIVLLAALRPGRNHDEDAYLANVSMAANLCHAIRIRGCAHLVYVSSDSVYPFNTVPIDESMLPAATSLYSLMHLAREEMVANLTGIPAAILRVAQVYGTGDPHNAYGPNRMVRSALRERRITLFGTGEETRDHIHVADVARLVATVLQLGSHGRMNVASGRSVSFAALAEIVKDVCGGDVVIEHAPQKMPVSHRQFDISLLRAVFPGFEFVRLEQGVAAMAEDVRRNGVTTAVPERVEHRLSCADDEIGQSRDVPSVSAAAKGV